MDELNNVEILDKEEKEKKYKLLPEEQEVHITFSEIEESAKMYTSIKKWIKKMDKMVSDYPDVFKCVHRDAFSATYEFPSKNVSIRKGNPKIELSEEERARRSEQMKNARKGEESA